MQKTLLTKEQAIALESALECCEERANIVENAVNGLWSGKREALKQLSLDKLIVALYIGYEIDQSKEEKLIAYINELNKGDEDPFIATAKLLGVMKTLEILGIDLKEVNGDVRTSNGYANTQNWVSKRVDGRFRKRS